MTPAQLYEWSVKHNCIHKPILIDITDSYHDSSFQEKFNEKQLSYDKECKQVFVDIRINEL